MNARYALVLYALLTFISSIPAHAVDIVMAQKLSVTNIGDVDLNCHDLSKEAGHMRNIIEEQEHVQEDHKMQGYGVNAAAGIGGFLAGTVTGGIGFAAIGLLASEALDADTQEAEDLKDIAAQRRSLMAGIFKAKGCYGPIEHVFEALRYPDTEQLTTINPSAGATSANLKRTNSEPLIFQSHHLNN